MTCLQGYFWVVFDWKVGKKANIYSPRDGKITAGRKVLNANITNRTSVIRADV